jgi:16S rRNA (guanine527-N7)-methyltransferase
MMNVRDALEVSRTFGFLGPGPVDDHVRHAEGFALAIEQALRLLETRMQESLQTTESVDPTSSAALLDGLRCADLGTGGGVPGLVLIERFPTSNWVLLDSSEKRIAAVEDLVVKLGFEQRCALRVARAEELGRMADLRGSFDVVVASGPGVTAECAAPLLKRGGIFVVSEPPAELNRWDPVGLATLGLTELIRIEQPFRFFVAQQEVVCPDRYPRRVGIPQKRPLFPK